MPSAADETNLVIRDITEGDLAQVADFEAEIAAISFGADAVTDPAEHLPKLRRALDKGNDIMLALADAEKVHGWLWIAINTNSFTSERYANFRSFALREAVRGGQSGQRLFAAGLARVRAAGGVKKVVGKVHVSNAPMRLLYKMLGFQPVHLTMELDLPA